MQQAKVLAEPIFVGREKEIGYLTQSLENAISGKGSTIFISGEAGSGKTRLVNEFLKNVKIDELTVLAGWCLSDVAVPYFPFIEAFDSYLSNGKESVLTNRKTVLKSWLLSSNQSELKENIGNVQSHLWKDRAFHGVIKELLFLSAKKPLVLILEDIHWADSASLSLLHYLSRQIDSERILILATFRSEELRNDSMGYPNQLSKVLLLMGRDNLYEELELSNLGITEVRIIAESMLGGKVYPDFVKRLSYDSHGTPLFIIESLRMLYQQKNLCKKNGQWNLRVDNIVIPQKVRDVILRRLETLSSDQRKILDIASVVGEKFDPRLVSEIISRDYADVLIVLNKIEKSTLMIRSERKGYRFDHIQFRKMLYNEIPSLLKKEYHLRIAENFERAKQSGSNIPETDLAYHFVQADNKNKAIKYSLQAGKVALDRFSNEEAIRYFSYVINAVKKNPKYINERLFALEGLGDAFLANSMFKESIRALKELGTSTQNGSTKLRAYRKAMDSAFQLGDISQLIRLIEKAKPYATSDRLEQARILVCRGRSFHLRSMLSEATKDMEKALQIFEEEYSPMDVGWALIGLGAYHSGAGLYKEGMAEALRSIAIFEEFGDYRWQMEAYNVAGMAFNFCFLEQKALEMFAKVSKIDNKEKMDDYLRLLYANAFSSRSFESMGDFKKALICSLKALEYSKKTDSLLAIGVVYANLTRQYSLLGNIEKAEEYFNQLMQIPPEILADPRIVVASARPVLYAGKCKWAKSIQLFKEILDRLESSNFPEFILSIVRLYYAWALDKQGFSNKAKLIIEENQKKRKKIEDLFKKLDIRAKFMVPIRIKVGQKFYARLDIVNVSTQPCYLKNVENFINSKLKVAYIQPGYKKNKESISLGNEVLKPFGILTVTVGFQARYPDKINFNPKINYIDDFGKSYTYNIKNIQISVEPNDSTKIEQIQFKSIHTQRAFDFLLRAFWEDHIQEKLSLEKSGWRSLMDVVRRGHITKHSIYGRSGSGGKVLSELMSLGLVEQMFFVGERGRGGKVLKVRICPDKKNVKQYFEDDRIKRKK